MSVYLDNKKDDFNNVIDFFKKDISSLRTGRANPAVLEGINVEAYGVATPINGVANISVQDGKNILITPWDKNVSKEIEKAIVDAGLGLGVNNEGDKIRLTLPQMTEENRKDLVKRLNEKQEKSRISIRKIRDNVKDLIENAEKDKEITVDDKFVHIKELDGMVAEKNADVKELRDKKEKEIMTI